MRINRLRVKLVLAGLMLLAVVAGLAVQAHAQAKLKTYKTKYYIIHTDLDTDGVQEAIVRMTAMADEYRRRTRGFSGKIRKRLPFYLFRNSKDYYAFGGIKGSAGVFMGGSLMAIAGEKTSGRTWHIVQHEGFHQFAHATIGRGIPIWADEGMAEYFGQGIFTGDGFVVGVIPPRRLARLKNEIKENKVKSFSKMMTMTNREWVKEMAMVNYDQAWSMIYFLIRAENGKYQKATMGFLKDISRGRLYLAAWTRNFGSDIKIFEKRWREYWLALPKNPTADLYDKAVAATLTSFFARAFSQRQKFKDADEFFQTARAGKLKAHKKDRLPKTLLTNALDKAGKIGKWSIEATKGRSPKLICIRDDGKQFVGTFVLKAGKVSKIDVKIVEKKETKEKEKN
jgi:hypothetical protein